MNLPRFGASGEVDRAAMIGLPVPQPSTAPSPMKPSKPDPANDSELTVINAALTHAQQAIQSAHKAICELRPSDEYVQALDALERAKAALDRFQSDPQRR